MKMLYILNTTSRVNNFSYSSMIAAKQEGCDFHIAGNWTGYKWSEDREIDEKKYGIKIHQIDFIRTPYAPQNIIAYKQLVRLCKKEKFDVIHCNTPVGGVLGRLVGKRCKVSKIIYEVHGFHFYQGAPLLNWLIYYPIEKWLAHVTDVLVTINKEDREIAEKKFHLRKDGKVYYVPGVGIETSEFYRNKEIRNKIRKELNIDQDNIVFISVGELNTNKNNKVIINALKNINDKNIKYLICGVGTEEQSLKDLVTSYGLGNQVKFLGFRTDIKDLFSAADIFVLSSYREGLSRSIMEAMASGLPCVVSRIRGNVDLIDENGGYLCNPHSIEEFKEALESLISDKTLLKTMGDYNAVKVQMFSLERVIHETKKIYKEALKNV